MEIVNKKYDKTAIIEKIITRLMIYFNVIKYIDLAKALEISQPTLSKWKDRGTIDIELILNKCEGINLNWLFYGEGPIRRSEDNKVVIDKEEYEQMKEIIRVVKVAAEAIK